MDLSPLQAGAKSRSSDFSIKRILSDESSSSREVNSEVNSPSWLCSTRYQPPRLQRTVNACRIRRSGRHARVPFTAAQAAALEAAYTRAPYLAPPALRALAAALHLRDDRIKIWFQNRRARERREKCATITPPQAMTLTPTTALPRGTLISNPTSTSYHTLTDQQYTETVDGSANHVEIASPEDLSSRATFPVPLFYTQNSRCSDDIEHTRPETPLDVET